jgi:hypothetical protein
MNSREDHEWSMGPTEIRRIELVPDHVEPHQVQWISGKDGGLFWPRLIRVTVRQVRKSPEAPLHSAGIAPNSIRVELLGRRILTSGKVQSGERIAELQQNEHANHNYIQAAISRATNAWYAANEIHPGY